MLAAASGCVEALESLLEAVYVDEDDDDNDD